MLQKEIDAADHSIDMAVAHFVDLLDAKQQQQQQSSTNINNNATTTNSSDSRHAPPTTNHQDDTIPTEVLVKRIKQLRAEISKLKLVQQQSIVTTTTTTTVDGKLC
jgi:hypothetical protein